MKLKLLVQLQLFLIIVSQLLITCIGDLFIGKKTAKNFEDPAALTLPLNDGDDNEAFLNFPTLGYFEKQPVGNLLLCFVLTLTWSYWRMTISRLGRNLEKFPGPLTLPFFGTAYVFMGKPEDLKNKIHHYVEKYGGRSFRIWKFHHPYVILMDPDEIELILASKVHLNKGLDYKNMHYMNGDGLVTSSADVWREDRKILNHSFKYHRFPTFLKAFNFHSKTLVSVVRKMFPTGLEDGDMHPAICRCTMDTVFESVLGTSFNIQENYEIEETADALYKAGEGLIESYRVRSLKPWQCLPVLRHFSGFAKMEHFAKTTFTKMMTKVVQERKKVYANVGDSRKITPAFVDPLLGTRTNQNLVDHAFSIFGAGFETNATTINFVLFLLANHPEIQDRVVEEIEEVFGKDGPIEATMKSVAALKYLEMCILETMRLFPPAPILARNLKEDILLPSGLVLPEGTDVAIFVHEIQNDPNVYPNPPKYDPNRFLPENVRLRSPFSYLPFSKGPRSCIGQKYAMLQMKVVLAHLLKEFKVSTKVKLEDVNIIYGVMIEIDKHITLTLESRNGRE